MAVVGYVVHLVTGDLSEMLRLLRSISNNVNQIARRCNETRNLYADDVEDLRKGYVQVWQIVSGLMEKFKKV